MRCTARISDEVRFNITIEMIIPSLGKEYLAIIAHTCGSVSLQPIKRDLSKPYLIVELRQSL